MEYELRPVGKNWRAGIGIAHVYAHEMIGDMWQVVYSDGREYIMPRLFAVRELAKGGKLHRGMHPDPDKRGDIPGVAAHKGFRCYWFETKE